jgi:hypothetical protein
MVTPALGFGESVLMETMTLREPPGLTPSGGHEALDIAAMGPGTAAGVGDPDEAEAIARSGPRLPDSLSVGTVFCISANWAGRSTLPLTSAWRNRSPSSVVLMISPADPPQDGFCSVASMGSPYFGSSGTGETLVPDGVRLGDER